MFPLDDFFEVSAFAFLWLLFFLLRIFYFDLRCEHLLVCHPNSSQNEWCGWLQLPDSRQFAQTLSHWISIRKNWFATIQNLISMWFGYFLELWKFTVTFRYIMIYPFSWANLGKTTRLQKRKASCALKEKTMSPGSRTSQRHAVGICSPLPCGIVRSEKIKVSVLWQCKKILCRGLNLMIQVSDLKCWPFPSCYLFVSLSWTQWWSPTLSKTIHIHFPFTPKSTKTNGIR